MVGGKDMREFEDLVKRSVEESIETKRAISGALLPRLVAAAEMEGRFAFDRRPLPALALHANVSTLTAIGNDYGYEQVYTRTLRAHARPGDVVVAISTSGTSKNVVAAAKLKSELGIKVIALTGEGGGMLAEHADVLIAVPSRSTARIQESHIVAGHLLCEWVEREMFATAAHGR
jgi:D-sedoheptulose 7-phosphate isomerase